MLLLAGAVAAVLVLGSDAAPAGPSDRVVPAAIGDPRTVDPCGLVDPAALAARTGGEARVVPDLGGPAACVVDVAAPGGDVAVIATLEPVATTVGAAQEERVGALLVRRVAPQPGSCTRTVVTTEGVQVSLDAIAPAGSGADPCAAADTATDSTLRVLQQGTTLPRRATEDPPTALTSVDTCSLLTRSDLGAVPGLDPASVAPGVGGWSCRWGTGAGGVVDVGVERRRAFAPTADVAGRQAAVTPQQSSCDVALAQRAYTATDGTPRVELLEVTVFGATTRRRPLRRRDPPRRRHRAPSAPAVSPPVSRAVIRPGRAGRGDARPRGMSDTAPAGGNARPRSSRYCSVTIRGVAIWGITIPRPIEEADMTSAHPTLARSAASWR